MICFQFEYFKQIYIEIELILHQIISKLNIDFKNITFLYPTDTTFGIGCSALNVEAIQKIHEIKNRPGSKSFILLVDSDARLQRYVEVPSLAWDIIDLSEKPTTIIYDAPRDLPKELIAEDNTIAIRLTKDPLCQKIIQKLNAPLVSTSANLSGEASPQSFQEINQKIKEGVDFIFPECETFQPKYTASSIIKLSADGVVKIIRE